MFRSLRDHHQAFLRIKSINAPPNLRSLYTGLHPKMPQSEHITTYPYINIWWPYQSSCLFDCFCVASRRHSWQVLYNSHINSILVSFSLSRPSYSSYLQELLKSSSSSSSSSPSSYSWRVRHVSFSLILKMKLVHPSLLRSSDVPSSFWSIS